jgi:hypothetical protein
MFSLGISIPVTVYLERKLRDNIRRAKLVCHGFEDTRECKLAWDRVDDIQKAINKTKDKAKASDSASESDNHQCEFDERACREYDV